MFSRFSSNASIKLIMLLLFLGVAVRSRMKHGLNSFSISTLKSVSALWLSSTTTNGFKNCITFISEISSSLPKSVSKDCNEPFCSKTFRPSLFAVRILSKLRTKIFSCSFTEVALNPLPCSKADLSKTSTLLPKCELIFWR